MGMLKERLAWCCLLKDKAFYFGNDCDTFSCSRSAISIRIFEFRWNCGAATLHSCPFPLLISPLHPCGVCALLSVASPLVHCMQTAAPPVGSNLSRNPGFQPPPLPQMLDAKPLSIVSSECPLVPLHSTSLLPAHHSPCHNCRILHQTIGILIQSEVVCSWGTVVALFASSTISEWLCL